MRDWNCSIPDEAYESPVDRLGLRLPAPLLRSRDSPRPCQITSERGFENDNTSCVGLARVPTMAEARTNILWYNIRVAVTVTITVQHCSAAGQGVIQLLRKHRAERLRGRLASTDSDSGRSQRSIFTIASHRIACKWRAELELEQGEKVHIPSLGPQILSGLPNSTWVASNLP